MHVEAATPRCFNWIDNESGSVHPESLVARIIDTPEALSQVLGRRDPTGLDRGGFFLCTPLARPDFPGRRGVFTEEVICRDGRRLIL